MNPESYDLNLKVRWKGRRRRRLPRSVELDESAFVLTNFLLEVIFREHDDVVGGGGYGEQSHRECTERDPDLILLHCCFFFFTDAFPSTAMTRAGFYKDEEGENQNARFIFVSFRFGHCIASQ